MPKKKSRKKKVARRKSGPKRKVVRGKSRPKRKVVRKKIKQDNINDPTELVIKTKPQWIKASLASKATYQKKI